jgi:hypothetical protein
LQSSFAVINFCGRATAKQKQRREYFPWILDFLGLPFWMPLDHPLDMSLVTFIWITPGEAADLDRTTIWSDSYALGMEALDVATRDAFSFC